ncbi:MAG: hypothetical protein ACOCSL_00615 [Thermoplasmatota archaeon]
MKRYTTKKEWNGKRAKNDPQKEYAENLIYLLYKENQIEVYFESQRLVNGILEHNHLEEIEEIHYDQRDDRPISVKGKLPLNVLTIKSKPRKKAYAKKVIP